MLLLRVILNIRSTKYFVAILCSYKERSFSLAQHDLKFVLKIVYMVVLPELPSLLELVQVCVSKVYNYLTNLLYA